MTIFSPSGPASRRACASAWRRLIFGDAPHPVATGAGADFDDHIALVVGVARQQGALGIGLDLLNLFAKLGDFHLREFAHFVVIGLVEDFAGLLQLVRGGAVLIAQVDLLLQRRMLSGQRLQA